jgi:hypothetical protein
MNITGTGHLKRISANSVGFGEQVRQAGTFEELLREPQTELLKAFS